jgi:high frequency lysogenization protein
LAADEQQHRNRVLALAGLFQAAALVKEIARTGAPEAEPYAASIHSVLQIEAADVETIFGNRQGLKKGLGVLAQQLGKQSAQRDLELTRYAVSLLFLERKLVKRAEMLQRVRDGIEAAASQAEYFSELHENVIARLADIYSETLSRLAPRILVTGETRYLEDPTNANKIRALLLAGIRAAVLWRQLGGNRLRLLFTRRRLITTAEAMRAELDAAG